MRVRPPLLLAIVASALMVLPVLPGGWTGGTGALAAPVSTDGPVAALPAPLAAPWAARAGFSAAYLSEVPLAVPASGAVQATVGLWPADPSLFAPRGPGAPALTPSEFTEQFGRSPTEYAALEQYFTGKGLTVVHLWPDRLAITVAGPAPALGAAFGTTLLSGEWGGHPVQFPASVPRLPEPYASEVASITGLADGFSTVRFSLAPAPGSAGPAQGRTSTFITPSATHLLYGMSALYNSSGTARFATGTRIAVVLWGDGYAPSDLQTFFSTYYPAGFPAATISYVNVDGAPAPSASATSDPSLAPQELTLDLEWAGSAAPGATLTAVYAPDGPASNAYSPTDTTLEDALRTAVDLPGVDVVSMSFGTPDGGDLALQSAFALSLSKAAQLGITVLAASGDTGGTAKASCQGGAAPDFPATYPTVVAVGGSAPVESLDTLGNVVGLDSEPAWNGSGGGYSSVYPAPSWQAATVPSIAQVGQRAIPDVAGPAYDNFFYYNGGERAGRGTSFATPMWAGVIAEVDAILGHSLGTVAPRFYSIGPAIAAGKAAEGLVDITSGANCVANAGTGWDLVTGWGSPRALPLYADLSSSYATVGLTASPSSVAPGQSVTAVATVLNISTHQPIAGLTVAFSLTAPGYSGPCGGTLSTAEATTDANGNASATLSVPNCFLGSAALLSVVVASGGYFGLNSTNIAVNLVGLAGFLAFIQVFPYNLLAFVLIVAVAIGLGYWIGERRRPRTRRVRVPSARRAPPSPGAAGTTGPPAASPPPSAPREGTVRVDAGSPNPPGPPAPPPVAESTAEVSAGPPALPTVPAHVLEPPPPPPPVDLPRVPVRRCPTCLAAVGAGARTCPDCGSPLPAEPAGGSSAS